MGWWDFTTGVTPNLQVDGTLTVGSDGVGHDVTLYGDTAGSRLVWDADTNTLQLIVSKFTQTWTTSQATAGEQGLKLTTTDSVTQTAGIIQSLLVDHNITGAKSGSAQNEAISVDMDIGANVIYAYPFASYVSKTGNPNIGFVAGHSIYLEDMGSGTLGGVAGLDIQIGSTNLGSRHTGIRLVSHTGTARSGILFEKAWTVGIDLSGTGSGGVAATMATADIKFHHGHTILDSASTLTLDTALAMGSNKITGVTDPTAAQDAATKYWTENTAIIPSTNVEVSELNTATYDDLQNFINNTVSAGRTSGGVIEASGASGNVKVNLGTGFIKTTDSAIGETKAFDWDDTIISAGASAGDIIDLDVNYIYIDYSAGSPVPKATTDRTAIELNRMFTLGRVYRSGTALHTVNSGSHLDNHLRLNHERLIQVRGFERASGGVVSETGDRYLVTTAGIFFLGGNKATTEINDTSPNGTPDILTRWYHDAEGDWVANADSEGASLIGQISNEHYDTGTALADIGVARYGVFWVFIHYDGDLQVVYGRDSYKLADAENAIVPALPNAVSEFSTLAAKIIVAQGDPNFTSVVSAYETLFPVSTPPEHNDLGVIQGGQADQYYHLTSALYTKYTTTVTATGAELNLLDLAGLTAGELLVATGAATAAWQSTGVVLTAPKISGTVTTDGLTMPAFTLSGALTLGSQTISGASVFDSNMEISTAANATRILKLINDDTTMRIWASRAGYGALGTETNNDVVFFVNNTTEIMRLDASPLALRMNQNITFASDQTVDGIDVSAHDIATTGVHGAGENTILYSDHTANADAHGEPVVTCDTDSATADDLAFSIVGGEGIDTSGATSVVTITAEAASTTNKGVVELATGEETNTGTSATLAVTPDGLDDWVGSAQITTVGTVASGTLSTGAVLADVTMTLGSDADGDVYYRASNKLARLAKGSATQVLTMNAGETAPEWAAAAGNGATKEFFVPVNYASEPASFGASIDTGGDTASAQLIVPQDFTTLTSIEVILKPRATGASMYLDILTRYGAYNGGENYNVHTETADARNIGATVNLQNLAHSISDLVDVAALAAGDCLMVTVTYDATAVASNLHFRGLRLKYT